HYSGRAADVRREKTRTLHAYARRQSSRARNGGSARGVLHNTTKNWQPRVGLAYRLRTNTAVRASFRIFFDEWSAIAQRPQNLQGQWPGIGAQSTSNLNVPTPAQPTATIKGTNPFPGGSVLPPPTPFTGQQVYVDPYLRNPYSMQWNFGIQHQINLST